MPPLVIFGTDHFAEVAYHYFTHDSDYDVVAFTVNKKFMKKNKLFSLPVISFEELEKYYPPSHNSIFIAIGYSKVNKIRSKIFSEVKQKGYVCANYIHSNAVVSNNVKFGENCFVFENNVIQPFTKIGDDVIFWSGNHIGHHSSIGDHCFITSHVVIAGNTIVEPFCFLGINATIRDGITISKECVIGAGTIILHSTKEKEVYAAIPTKPLSKKSDELESL